MDHLVSRVSPAPYELPPAYPRSSPTLKHRYEGETLEFGEWGTHSWELKKIPSTKAILKMMMLVPWRRMYDVPSLTNWES